MATFVEAIIASTTTEIRGWTADFTDDLPTGITVTSGTATHVPPSGSAQTPTISTTTPNVTATLAAGLVVGLHYILIQATLSNGEKSEVRIAFQVADTSLAARAGMAAIISDLRGMTDTGPNDYAVGGATYWSDKQLQDMLDRRRTNLRFVQLRDRPDYTNGTVIYKDFSMPVAHVESGTALEVVDYLGSAIGTALYSFDANQSLVSFASDQAGSAVYCNAHAYHLNTVAADVWRRKAAHYAAAYDISTDNHNLRRSQLIAQCKAAAEMYENMDGPNNISMERWDTSATASGSSGAEPDHHKRFMGGW
jgi:hypothetical protein